MVIVNPKLSLGIVGINERNQNEFMFHSRGKLSIIEKRRIHRKLYIIIHINHINHIFHSFLLINSPRPSSHPALLNR